MQEVPELVYRAARESGLYGALKSPNEIKVADFVLPESIAAMQLMAQEHGGDCLSTFYVNNNTKLRWRCAKGHEWEAILAASNRAVGALNVRQVMSRRSLPRTTGNCRFAWRPLSFSGLRRWWAKTALAVRIRSSVGGNPVQHSRR